MTLGSQGTNDTLIVFGNSDAVFENKNEAVFAKEKAKNIYPRAIAETSTLQWKVCYSWFANTWFTKGR